MPHRCKLVSSKIIVTFLFCEFCRVDFYRTNARYTDGSQTLRKKRHRFIDFVKRSVLKKRVFDFNGSTQLSTILVSDRNNTESLICVSRVIVFPSIVEFYVPSILSFTDFHKSFYYHFLRKYQAKELNSSCLLILCVCLCLCAWVCACVCVCIHVSVTMYILYGLFLFRVCSMVYANFATVICEDASKLFRISPITYNFILHSVPYIHCNCVQ